jgi:hypothetical protein
MLNSVSPLVCSSYKISFCSIFPLVRLGLPSNPFLSYLLQYFYKNLGYNPIEINAEGDYKNIVRENRIFRKKYTQFFMLAVL